MIMNPIRPKSIPLVYLGGSSRLKKAFAIAIAAGGLLLQRPHALQAQASSHSGLSLFDVVQVTLDRHASIRMQKAQLFHDEAGLLVAKGVFDPQLSASLSTGHEETPLLEAQRGVTGHAHARQDVAMYRLGLSKRFRSGVSLDPRIEVTYTDLESTGHKPAIRTHLGLELTVPVLRGRGASLNAARINAAEAMLDASALTLHHTTARALVRAAYAYWQYLSATHRLDILTRSEERARLLLTETEALVEAGERPAADLDQPRANLADKIIARISAEQNLHEARQDLGLAMGLSFDRFSMMPNPSEDFPTSDGVLETVPSEPELLRIALAHRADLHSLYRREKAAHTLFRAAQNETKPRFDLQIATGYSGLSEGGDFRAYLPPMGQNDLAGVDASVSLIYGMHTGNRNRRGIRQQQESIYQQRRLAAIELERQISAGVAVATAALQQSVLELGKARESVVLYRKSVENEKKKLRLGMATLFDVILVEDRLTNAMLGEVGAKQRYAQALARLRFETGSLPLGDQASLQDQVRALTTIPSLP